MKNNLELLKKCVTLLEGCKKMLYKPFVNTGKGNHKYKVYVKADTKTGIKLIGFGHKDFKDFSQHGDEKRRKSYLARAKGIKNKKGELTYKDKNSKNFWSVLLWSNPSPKWATYK